MSIEFECYYLTDLKPESDESWKDYFVYHPYPKFIKKLIAQSHDLIQNVREDLRKECPNSWNKIDRQWPNCM